MCLDKSPHKKAICSFSSNSLDNFRCIKHHQKSIT